MDWEPEIPGQFDTPLRIRRKRTAVDAGFSITSSDAQFPVAVLAIQPFLFENKYFQPIVHKLSTTFRIVYQLFSATHRGAKISETVATRRLVETRQVMSDGQEAVKRRATDSSVTRPVAPTSHQTTRDSRQSLHKKLVRASPRRAESLPMASPHASQLAIPPGPSVQHLKKSSVGGASLLESESMQSAIDREALGARILASFTPCPLPGVAGPRQIAPSTLSTPAMGGRPVSLTTAEEWRGTNTINPERDFVVSARSQSPTYQMDKTACRTQSSPIDTASGYTSQRLPVTHVNDSVRSTRMRRSHPSSIRSDLRTSFNRSTSASDTPRRVRFAIDPKNGLPHEHSVKFFKESIVGEWAPSSPWAEEQALVSMSDLNANLESLMADESLLPPPTIPSQQSAVTCPASIVPGEGPCGPTRPIHIFSPKGDDDSVSEPASMIAGSTLSSSEVLDTHRQRSGIHLPIHKNYESRFSETSPVQASPLIRMKRFVEGSIRNILFKSPPVLSSIAIDQRKVVKLIASTDMPDAPSQSTELSQTPSLSNSKLHIGVSPEEQAQYPVMHRAVDLSPVSDEQNVGDVCKLAKRENFGDSYESDESLRNMKTTVERTRNGVLAHSEDLTSARNSTILPLKPEHLEDAFVQLGLSEMTISRSMREKKLRQRKEREAAEVAEEAAAAKAKAETEEAERRARLNRRMPKQKLVKPLTKDWEAKIEEALQKGDHVPLTTTVSGTELRRRDLLTVLGERQWLNDEIINAYLEWIVEYANEKAGKNGRSAIPKVIAHNSFFYKNIATKGSNSVSRWMKRKKAEGKKLLEVETVLIPVNNAAHWTIIVVSPKSRTIEYLDSFDGSPKVFVNHTKAWLAAELGDAWHEEDWRVLDTRSANQLNGYDCGVFTITNAECVAGGVDTNSYDWSDMADQRRRIAGVLLNRGFGGEFVPAEEL